MDKSSAGLLLAIETSCDETAVALCDSQGRIVCSQIASQIALHAPYGGVVPELASRNHNIVLKPLIASSLEEAKASWGSITAIAATSGPGLSSSLLIGDTTAKAIAAGLGCPFFSINHMEGHLLSPFIESGLEIPRHVALVVSGGHTLLVQVNGVGDYKILGTTKDDAAGEAFDKVGKMLELPYPGGPEISKWAENGDEERFDFPRSMIDSGDHDFSFSGLKTAARYTIEKLPEPLSETDLHDLCASFEAAVVEVLTKKLDTAVQESGEEFIAISGGVSCNTALRRSCQKLAEDRNWRLQMASPEFTTDNAAMIAFAAAARRYAGVAESPLNTDIDPNLTLGNSA